MRAEGGARYDEHALEHVLDELDSACEGGDCVRVGGLVEAFGRRGYGAFLLLPALLEISPIGGIPGVPTVLALVVILFASQILVGRDHMWLPRILRERKLPAGKLDEAIDKARPLARRLDRWFHGRLSPLAGRAAGRIAAVLCVLLSCTVPPLEIVPFASTAPMGAIGLFGIALLVRDGLVMLAGFVLSGVALGVVVAVLA